MHKLGKEAQFIQPYLLVIDGKLLDLARFKRCFLSPNSRIMRNSYGPDIANMVQYWSNISINSKISCNIRKPMLFDQSWSQMMVLV